MSRSTAMTVVISLLVTGVCFASTPLSVSVTLDGPTTGQPDQPLTYLASGSFTLDGDTQTEVAAQEATIEEDGSGPHTIMVTYTVTVRYRDGTSDQAYATDAVSVSTGQPGGQQLTVEIIEPEAVRFDCEVDQPVALEAQAYLDGVPLDSALVTWEWDFGDESDPDADNPTEHTYTSTESLTITVTATYGGLQAQATSYPNVLPPHMFGSIVFARPHTSPNCTNDLEFDSEICDDVEFVWRSYDISRHFYGMSVFIWNGLVKTPVAGWGQAQLMTPQGEQWYWEAVSPPVITTQWANRQWDFGVDVVEALFGEEPIPPLLEWERSLTLTVNNTTIHSLGSGILLHDSAAASHEIGWTIGHREKCGAIDYMNNTHYWADPCFSVMVEILDLNGVVQRTIWTTPPAARGSGSYTWDGRIGQAPGLVAAPPGIYTYRVTAHHDGGSFDCEDQDKSRWLTVDVGNFYWLEKDAQAGTLTCFVKYGLTSDAGAVEIKYYDDSLELRGGSAATGLAAGEHYSEPITLHVAYDESGNPIEPVYCVVVARETDATGQLNRDGSPKPALPKGTSNLEPCYRGLFQVSFSGSDYYEVRMDDDSDSYSERHWQDCNFDGDTTDPGDRSYPACFRSGSKMRVGVTIKLDPTWGTPGDVVIRGDGPDDLDIPASAADENQGWVSFANGPVECGAGFPDHVHRYAPLSIVWEVSIDGGNTWRLAGSSQNEVFVYRGTTLHPSPGCTTPFRTVLYLACNNGGSDPDGIAENTWQMFAGPAHVKAWREADRDYKRPLHYYGPTGGKNDTAAELLAVAMDDGSEDFGNGTCNAWCDLLQEAWLVNNLAKGLWVEVLPPKNHGEDFWVKNSGPEGDPQWPEHEPFVYGPLNIRPSAEGIPGQNSPTPLQKLFARHWLVRRGGIYYDPSYGITTTGPADYTPRAISFFYHAEGPYLRTPDDEVTVRFSY